MKPVVPDACSAGTRLFVAAELEFAVSIFVRGLLVFALLAVACGPQAKESSKKSEGTDKAKTDQGTTEEAKSVDAAKALIGTWFPVKGTVDFGDSLVTLTGVGPRGTDVALKYSVRNVAGTLVLMEIHSDVGLKGIWEADVKGDTLTVVKREWTEKEHLGEPTSDAKSYVRSKKVSKKADLAADKMLVGTWAPVAGGFTFADTTLTLTGAGPKRADLATTYTIRSAEGTSAVVAIDDGAGLKGIWEVDVKGDTLSVLRRQWTEKGAGGAPGGARRIYQRKK